MSYGAANPTFDATLSGFKNGETLATSGVTGTPSCTERRDRHELGRRQPLRRSPAPSAACCSGNYSFTFVAGELTITKATLTVTANDKTRDVRRGQPGLRRHDQRLHERRDPGHLRRDRQPSCTTPRPRTSPVSGSPYADHLHRRQPRLGQLQFTFVAGELTITKATLTVTANDKTREYGAANPTFDATISGFKNGETLATSGVTGTPSCTQRRDRHELGRRQPLRHHLHRRQPAVGQLQLHLRGRRA